MILRFIRIVRRCFALAGPYGWPKLIGVFALILANGFMQVVGVTSVFPFFALASDPERIQHSRFGSIVLTLLPAMEHRMLLIIAGVVSIVLLFVSNACALLSTVLRMRYGHGLGHFLRVRMMQTLAFRPYGYFLGQNSGAILQKLLGDVTQFINSVFLPLLEALSRVVTLAFLMLTVFLVQPIIALGLGTLFGLFYFCAFLLLRRKSRMIGEGIKKANRGAYIAAQQFLGGIKPILVHGKTEYFVNEYTRHSAVQAKLYPRVPLYSNSPRYLIEPLAFGGVVGVVVWFAAQGKVFGDILPNLSVLALAGYRMIPSLQLLFAQLNHIHSLHYVVGEVESEVNRLLPSSVTERIPRAAPTKLPFCRAIRLDHVTFSYPSARRPVFQDLSLCIPKNRSAGIVGTTGSGKSTLVDLILGLHSPQSGYLLVDDRIIIEADLPAWRAMVGYVPQDIFLLDDSVTANIAFGLPPEAVDHEALTQAARAAQILDFIQDELPHGWDTLVGERGVRLSGGQRQRIGLARALYHRPEILVLDEATSALDVQTEADVMDAIRKLRGTMTMIIISHRLSTVTECDQVITIGSSLSTAAS